MCLDNGVVEPIGQAMIAGFHERPAEMLSMTEHAIAEDVFHLAWRLHAAAREVASSTDPTVASVGEEVVALTDEYLFRNYRQALHRPPLIEETDVTPGDGPDDPKARGPTNASVSLGAFMRADNASLPVATLEPAPSSERPRPPTQAEKNKKKAQRRAQRASRRKSR